MAGGLTKGPSHAKGGIKMKVKSTGQQIEVEGGEGIINKHVMSSKKKISYNTDMTPTDPSTGFDKGGLLIAGIIGYSLLSSYDKTETKPLENKRSTKIDSKFQPFIEDIYNEGFDNIVDGEYRDYDFIDDKKFNKLF